MFLPSCGDVTKSKSPLNFESLDGSGSLVNITIVDFRVIKSTILGARCISCHKQYDNYENVVLEIATISDAIENNRMPKSGPLSESQKSLFRAWVSIGAPEKVGDVIKVPLPKEPEANWISINQTIITPKCLACHNTNGQAKFLSLETRQDFFNNRNKMFGGEKFLDIEEPEKSYLLSVIQDDLEPMPPIWSNINKVTSEEINILKKWISLGLP